MRLAAGLAVVVAIPVAVLFYFQFRSLNDLEATSAVVLRQLSSDTADSMAKTVEESLKRPHISVLLRRAAGAHGAARHRRSSRRCCTDGLTESPFIDEFYVWSAEPSANGLGGRWLVFDRASATQNGPARRAASTRTPRFGDRLLPQAPADVDAAPGDRRLHRRRSTAGQHYIQAQLRWASPARERLTSLMAFAVDAERLRTRVLPVAAARRVSPAAAADRLPVAAASTLADDLGTRRRVGPRRAASSRSTSARSRWCSSTRNCSSSRRPTKRIARSGGCTPATARDDPGDRQRQHPAAAGADAAGGGGDGRSASSWSPARPRARSGSPS